MKKMEMLLATVQYWERKRGGYSKDWRDASCKALKCMPSN